MNTITWQDALNEMKGFILPHYYTSPRYSKAHIRLKLNIEHPMQEMLRLVGETGGDLQLSTEYVPLDLVGGPHYNPGDLRYKGVYEKKDFLHGVELLGEVIQGVNKKVNGKIQLQDGGHNWKDVIL